jgi:hypothetical protein
MRLWRRAGGSSPHVSALLRGRCGPARCRGVRAWGARRGLLCRLTTLCIVPLLSFLSAAAAALCAAAAVAAADRWAAGAQRLHPPPSAGRHARTALLLQRATAWHVVAPFLRYAHPPYSHDAEGGSGWLGQGVQGRVGAAGEREPEHCAGDACVARGFGHAARVWRVAGGQVPPCPAPRWSCCTQRAVAASIVNYAFLTSRPPRVARGVTWHAISMLAVTNGTAPLPRVCVCADVLAMRARPGATRVCARVCVRATHALRERCFASAPGTLTAGASQVRSAKMAEAPQDRLLRVDGLLSRKSGTDGFIRLDNGSGGAASSSHAAVRVMFSCTETAAPTHLDAAA